MSVLVRLRVELDDTPGCLAKVAAVIGRNERVEALVALHARLGRRLFSDMEAPIP